MSTNILKTYLLSTLILLLPVPIQLNSAGTSQTFIIHTYKELLDGKSLPFSCSIKKVMWDNTGAIIATSLNSNTLCIKKWENPLDHPTECIDITLSINSENSLIQPPFKFSCLWSVEEINPGLIQIINNKNQAIQNFLGTDPIVHCTAPHCIVYRGLVKDCTQATCLDWDNLIFDESQIISSYSAIVFRNSLSGNETDIQLISSDNGPQVISSFSLKHDGSLIAYGIEDGSIIIQTPPGLPD